MNYDITLKQKIMDGLEMELGISQVCMLLVSKGVSSVTDTPVSWKLAEYAVGKEKEDEAKR